MTQARKDAWRLLLDACSAFAAYNVAWTDLPVDTMVDPDTCLCVIDVARDITLRVEHTTTEYIAAGLSTRDEARTDGRPRDVGAWIHLTANIDGQFHQAAFCKIIIAHVFVGIEANALVSDIAKSTNALVNLFLDTWDTQTS